MLMSLSVLPPGYGSAAIKRALSIADVRGVPTVLETMTLQNKKMCDL